VNDRAVAKLCREWLAIYDQALPGVDGGDPQLQERFWNLYESLEIHARSLVGEAAARSLDSLPLSSLPSNRPNATVCTKPEQEAFFAAGKAVSILLRVVETESALDKRKLVALIHRFLVEVGDYLTWANLIVTNAAIHKQGRRTLREMSLGQGVVLPSQDDLDRIVELDLRKNEARATLAETGRNLAKELIQHGFKADGVLTVIHRADGGGGGPNAVAEIWEGVKVDLEGNLVALAVAHQRQARPPIESQVADDLMTRDEVALVSGIAVQTLKNQSNRFLGAPAVTPGRGRGKKFKWRYLEIRQRLEAETGNSMPTLDDAKRVIENHKLSR
jgi:hypothetical protein